MCVWVLVFGFFLNVQSLQDMKLFQVNILIVKQMKFE